jgi:hypothetical protein
MKETKYNGGRLVPVGFLNTDKAVVLAGSVASSAFGGDVTVRVTPTSGGVWVAIGETPTATADTNGNHYIESAQDFSIDKGDKIVATGTIQVTPFK